MKIEGGDLKAGKEEVVRLSTILEAVRPFSLQVIYFLFIILSLTIIHHFFLITGD
jgi:hypothetical protein